MADLSIWDWVVSKMHDQASLSKALLDKQVLKERFNCFNSEVEVLVLRVGKNVIQETGESDNQLSHQTSNHIDTVLFGFRVTDIVDFGSGRVELILSGSSNSCGSYFLKEKSDSVTLSSCVTLLLSQPFLLFLLLLLPEKLLLVLLTPLVFLDHGISVRSGLCSHAEIEQVVKVICVLS